MSATMISVAEAKEIIARSLVALSPTTLPLLKAAQHTLAQDFFATLDIPAFEQSSMDGYAFRFADKNLPLSIVGEVAAGASQQLFISEGEAARIFTGAPLPGGADTVVMQEKALIKDGKLVIEDEFLKTNYNVRSTGAEVQAGALAIKQGTQLSPAAIGFLAGIGTVDVVVYPMPSVSIILTGNELQAPGKPLSAGQVYESNSFSLQAALQQAGISSIDVVQSDDDVTKLKDLLQQALDKSDLILLTGGVSVGDYDFVLEAARQCDVQQKFHRVKQKPGKPLYFGMKGAKPVFGLPGNPSSVLSCFYNFVWPALDLLSNKKSSIRIVRATLTKSLVKPKGLTQFLKGHYEDGSATPLGAQESFQLSSFAQANCLLCLEEDRTDYTGGEEVQVMLLPGIN